MPVNVVTTAPGVQFSTIASAGFALLAALWQTSQEIGHDLVITSGTDGQHSGNLDPHHAGCAYDVRSHDIDEMTKSLFVQKVLNHLGDVQPSSGGWVTDYFFGWIEDAGQPNEHAHFQLRHNMTYPPNNNSESVRDAVNAEN